MFTPIGFFAGSGIEGLLDLYPSAYAAWSLRKLRGAYSGAAIQVTRTSDSATQDIGFVGEDLDTSALTTFIGANTGVVSIWYDQSGNGRDISISSALRPTIVSSGTLQTLSGGKPTMKPQSGQLGVDTGISGLTDKSVFFAGDTTNILGGTAATRVLSSYAGTGGVGSDYIISHYNGTPDFLRLFDQQTTATVYPSRGEIVIGSYANSGTIGIKANTLATATSTGTSTATPNNYHLFEDRGGVINNEIPTFASEYIIYNTSKDADLADIMSNIDTYYDIWTPKSIANAQYWWTADAGVTTSTGGVSVWTDQINSLTLEQSDDADRPSYGVSSNMNGQNTVTFNGTTDFLYGPSLPANLNGSDLTILVSYYLPNTTPGDGVVFGHQYVGTSQGRIWFDGFDDTIRFIDAFGSNTSGGNTVHTIQDPIVAGKKFSKMRYDSSNGSVYFAQDTLTETTTRASGYAGQEWSSVAVLQMGAMLDSLASPTPSLGRYIEMEVTDVVVIYGTPTTEEMNRWATYIERKYGTVLS